MSDWQGKIVVVTGGSSGLGRHIASEWSRRGATAVIVARDRQRLEEAAEAIRAESDGGACENYAADITNDDQVAGLRDWLRERFGQVDVLVNSAGLSDRGRVDETTIERFTQLLELNFLATVRCTQTLLPLIQPVSGSVVNIGSLASKSASSFLGAYPASKFPVAAFTQQLRLEHHGGSLHTLLVCPGPIARDDAGERYRDQSQEKGLPGSASRPGGGVKVNAIDPAGLSERIILACERRQAELIVPAKARLLFAIQQLSAGWGDWLTRKMTSG